MAFVRLKNRVINTESIMSFWDTTGKEGVLRKRVLQFGGGDSITLSANEAYFLDTFVTLEDEYDSEMDYTPEEAGGASVDGPAEEDAEENNS